MSKRESRLIFEVPKSEKEHRFHTVLEQLKQLKVKLNQPFVYRNELCVERNQFIHQYPNGDIFLIEQDQQDSSEKVLRVLS
ncbi:hypothetical protein ACTJKC_01890 [Pedobacter sp. 22226]|uniref:hypothetical protein n=1 Tax=Pedobacter sp. 22226 TaxID=3453894 RepID=UPI003F84C292